MDNEATWAARTHAQSSFLVSTEDTNTDGHLSNDLGDCLESDLVFGCQTKPELDTFAAQTANEIKVIKETNTISMSGEKKEWQQEDSDFCRIKVESLFKLKDSTKKLLYIIEEIQSKIHSSDTYLLPEEPPLPILTETVSSSQLSDLRDTASIKKLETETKNLDLLYLEKIDNDCSVFKRLTRKCHCLNRKEYNDFMIHFNEDTKYCTSNLGEIIKNMRILKKFLYIGDGYTKNALIFLNEGLTKCPHLEKVDMILACSHADICNVFEDESFVHVCITWPNRYENFGDQITQSLAARVLYRIAMIEEGRRYLNFNSKIANDIKKVLRKGSSHLNSDTLEFLNSTINLLSPAIAPHINATYYCKANEGMANNILNSLAHFRYYMTLEEVFTNLDILYKLSDTDKGKAELRQNLPFIFSLFKHLLMEYDNSDMNIIVTKITNSLMKKPPTRTVDDDAPKTFIVSDTATEPINMKHELNQIPSMKNLKRNKFSSKANRSRQASARNVGEWKSSRVFNRSKKALNFSFRPPFRPL